MKRSLLLRLIPAGPRPHQTEGCEAPAAEMIIRLGRLTPGYFRLLQRQVSGEVRVQPQRSLIDPIAVAMASVGTGLCLYSSRQMAERVQLQQPST